MNFDLRGRTELVCVSGSHAFGVATPHSDIDLQGYCIPPVGYLLGCNKHFEQYQEALMPDQVDRLLGNSLSTYAAEHNIIVPSEPVDLVFYSLAKFLKLSSDNNPNLMSALFAHDTDLLVCASTARELRKHRDLFLSARVKFTYSGYAIAQLKRIRTHRKWLLSPPDHEPTRLEFNLPETMRLPRDQLEAAINLIETKAKQWLLQGLDVGLSKEHIVDIHTNLAEFLLELQLMRADEELTEIAIRAVEHSLDFSANFLQLIKSERAHKQAKTNWKQYQDWKVTRNPARADLEARYGYDCKHAYHLVRLMRMAKEILTTGQVIVKRPDAEELQRIRNGAWTYDELIIWAEQMQTDIDTIYNEKKYVVPHTPDVDAINELCVGLHQIFYAD